MSALRKQRMQYCVNRTTYGDFAALERTQAHHYKLTRPPSAQSIT